MSLKDYDPKPARKNLCRVGTALEELEEEDAQQLRLWLSDPMISLSWIERVLAEAVNLRVPSRALARHRAATLDRPNACACAERGTL